MGYDPQTRPQGGEDWGSPEVARVPLDFFLRLEECLASFPPRFERFLYILRFRFLSRSLMYESQNDRFEFRIDAQGQVPTAGNTYE